MPARLSLLSDRHLHPAAGVLGGMPGAPSVIALDDGSKPDPKSRSTIGPGRRLSLLYAGGGGYGDPRSRERARVRADLRDGTISDEAAREGPARLKAMPPSTQAGNEARARIGVDVGGTFTDLVLHHPGRDLVHTGKLLTTPEDPASPSSMA